MNHNYQRKTIIIVHQQVRLAFNAILAILLFALPFIGFGQSGTMYVTANSLNLRSGPGQYYTVVKTLSKGTELNVKYCDGFWCKVTAGYSSGYVHSDFLSKSNPKTTSNYNYLATGSTPECSNVLPEYDYTWDNELKITVGNNTDVVVKLMKINKYGSDVCIRMAYVRTGDTYRMKSIPEAEYYLKIAYGKDWEQGITNGKCYGRFNVSPLYEEGEDILDFNVIKTYNGYSIPSYSVSLNVISTYSSSNLDTENISEEEFNK